MGPSVYIPPIILFALGCIVAVVLVYGLQARLDLARRDQRARYVLALIMSVVFVTSLTVGNDKPLGAFLVVAPPVILALALKYPNLRAWYVMAFRPINTWRRKDILRVIRFYTARNYDIMLKSVIYRVPSDQYTVTIVIISPTGGMVTLVRRMANSNEWVNLMFVLGLEPEADDMVRACVPKSCLYSVTLHCDGKTKKVARTCGINHKHPLTDLA